MMSKENQPQTRNETNGSQTAEQNDTADKVVFATAADGTVRCMAAVTTASVGEAVRRQQTAPTATAALGRALTGALLLGASLKDFDRLTVKIECEGIVEGITAETTSARTIRGYVKNPSADAPLNERGKLDVRGIVGEGMFIVTREESFNIGLYKEPYRGSVPLVSGEIAEDFAFYLTKSEQIPSAVLLGVLVNQDENGELIVTASGGVMIQMMPGATEETISEIERAIMSSPATTTLIHEGATPEDLLKRTLGSVEFRVLSEENVAFACTCSHQRAVSLIGSLDKAEIADMLEKDHGAVMNCHFCNETYRISAEELESLL